MYESAGPAYCPYFTGRSSRGGVNAPFGMQFHAFPGGCPVRQRPQTRRANPNPVRSQFHPFHPSMLHDALGLAGSFVDSLMSRNQSTRGTRGHHSPTQQKQGDRKVSPDTKGSCDTDTLTSPEAATKQTCPCQHSMEPCCPQSAKPTNPEKKEEPLSADTTGKSANNTIASNVWLQPISLRGFAPNEVKVHVTEGGVHVHAKAEKSSGPGPCLSRYEMMRTVKIPADVDQKSVSCVMTPNGTILIYAPRMTSSTLEEKTGKTESVMHQPAEEKVQAEEKTEPKHNEAVEREESTGEREQPEEETESKPSEDAEEKEESTVEAQSDVTKFEETLLSQGKAHPAPAVSEHEAEAPESPADVSTETQMKTEKEAESNSTEDKDKEGKCTTVEVPDTVQPIVELPEDQPIVELPEEDISSDDEETCLVECIEAENADSGAEDFEVISTGCATDTTTIDSDGELAEHEELTLESDGTKDVQPAGEETGTETDTPARDTFTNTPAVDTDPTPPIKRIETAEESKHSDSTNPTSQTQSSDNTEPFSTVMPLGGYHPEDLQIKLKDRSLLVTAEREGSYGGVVYTDRTQRRLELPEHVDVTTVRCVYREDGVLVITALPNCGDKQVPVQQN